MPHVKESEKDRKMNFNNNNTGFHNQSLKVRISDYYKRYTLLIDKRSCLVIKTTSLMIIYYSFTSVK
jgi:hypothetical protein